MYRVVLLHDSLKVIIANITVLGSAKCHRSNSSLVLVEMGPNKSTLCEIQLQVYTNTMRMRLAAVKTFYSIHVKCGMDIPSKFGRVFLI